MCGGLIKCVCVVNSLQSIQWGGEENDECSLVSRHRIQDDKVLQRTNGCQEGCL